MIGTVSHSKIMKALNVWTFSKVFVTKKTVSIVLKVKDPQNQKKKKKLSSFRKEWEQYPYECFIEICIDP